MILLYISGGSELAVQIILASTSQEISCFCFLSAEVKGTQLAF